MFCPKKFPDEWLQNIFEWVEPAFLIDMEKKIILFILSSFISLYHTNIMDFWKFTKKISWNCMGKFYIKYGAKNLYLTKVLNELLMDVKYIV